MVSLECKRANVGQSVMDDRHPILVKFWMACALERTSFGCLSIAGGIGKTIVVVVVVVVVLVVLLFVVLLLVVARGMLLVVAVGNSLVGTWPESPTCCEAESGKKGDGRIVDVFDDMSNCGVFGIEIPPEGLNWLTHVEKIWTRVNEESVAEVVVGFNS
jgi:hypothetical protein